jgi:hypothetical protein
MREPLSPSELYEFAFSSLESGKPPKVVKKGLVRRGATSTVAAEILQRAAGSHCSRVRMRGLQFIALGCLMFPVGAVILVVILAYAPRSRGIALVGLGLLLFGLAFLARGFNQAVSGREIKIEGTTETKLW